MRWSTYVKALSVYQCFTRRDGLELLNAEADHGQVIRAPLSSLKKGSILGLVLPLFPDFVVFLPFVPDGALPSMYHIEHPPLVARNYTASRTVLINQLALIRLDHIDIVWVSERISELLQRRDQEHGDAVEFDRFGGEFACADSVRRGVGGGAWDHRAVDVDLKRLC